MRTIDADRLKAVLEKNFGHTGEASVLEQLIDEQPTIEPSTNCSEIPNSSDTISRQAAIDAFEDTTFTKNEIRRRLSDLPPAQPEPHEGHWIPVTNGRGGHECDRCHEYAPSYQSGSEHLSKYCPNCGARMKGERQK